MHAGCSLSVALLIIDILKKVRSCSHYYSCLNGLSSLSDYRLFGLFLEFRENGNVEIYSYTNPSATSRAR